MVKALHTRIDDLALRLNDLHAEFRSRDFWEQLATDIATLKANSTMLMASRERNADVRERIAALEAHYNDLMTLSRAFSKPVDLR